MSLRVNALSILISGVLAVADGPVQATIIDYNTPGDLAANFSLNHNGAGNMYAETVAGGLGGSGAINPLPSIDGVHTTAAFSPNAFGFSNTADSVTVSQFALRQPHNTTFGINFSFMQLGLLADVTDRLGISSAPDAYLSLRVLSDPTVSDARVFLQSEVKTSGSGRIQDVIAGQTADLIAGNWYRFSTTFENVSATEVLITGALEDWGADGLTLASTVLELTSLNPQSLVNMSGLTGTSALGDSSVWAGWRGFDRGGADLFDNFSVVPEPAAIWLIGLGAVTALRRSRR
ncbi:MAG: PEP-CTERM sorting domain-containing protein [Phycisphaerae bacterium]